jgi:hypothetical protein
MTEKRQLPRRFGERLRSREANARLAGDVSRTRRVLSPRRSQARGHRTIAPHESDRPGTPDGAIALDGRRSRDAGRADNRNDQPRARFPRDRLTTRATVSARTRFHVGRRLSAHRPAVPYMRGTRGIHRADGASRQSPAETRKRDSRHDDGWARVPRVAGRATVTARMPVATGMQVRAANRDAGH